MTSEKTLEQKLAWLDGYKAAAQTVDSFEYYIGGTRLENLDFLVVSTLLNNNVEKFEKELEDAK